jgi:hypothetical protein
MCHAVCVQMRYAAQGLECETPNAFDVKTDAMSERVILAIGVPALDRVIFTGGKVTVRAEATSPSLHQVGGRSQHRQHNAKVTSTIVLETKGLERPQAHRVRRHKFH